MKRFLTHCLVIVLFASNCSDNKNILKSESFEMDIKIAKWLNNKTAAITLTYDSGTPERSHNQPVNQLLIENDMTIDYEIVTALYNKYPNKMTFLRDELVPLGFGYFGHGHEHINHDEVNYEEAYESFKKCYDSMNEWGLKPVAYAYPNGAGWKSTTRQALEDAGFLCGRMHSLGLMVNPYILPGEELYIEDWYKLPTLVMQGYEYNQCDKCVNNNEELIPYLDENLLKKTWIMLTYHSIGVENGLGYFPIDEFEKNLNTIKEYDFWQASMSEAVLYIKERANTVVDTTIIRNKKSVVTGIEFRLIDNLPNELYDQELTLLFNIPNKWINKSIGLFLQDSLIQSYKFENFEAMISIPPDEEKYKLSIIKD